MNEKYFTFTILNQNTSINQFISLSDNLKNSKAKVNRCTTLFFRKQFLPNTKNSLQNIPTTPVFEDFFLSRNFFREIFFSPPLCQKLNFWEERFFLPKKLIYWEEIFFHPEKNFPPISPPPFWGHGVRKFFLPSSWM